MLAVSVLATIANASPRVRLTRDGELPFSVEELRAAVALRVEVAEGEATAEELAVTVRSYGIDAAMVSLGDKERLVPLGGRKGEAAARRVALAVADLAIAEAELPKLAPLAPVAVISKPAAPAQHPPPPELPRPPRAVLTLIPTVWFSNVIAAGSLGATVAMYGPLRATVEVGVGGGNGSTVDGIGVSLIAAPVRTGLAWRFRSFPLELRASFVVQGYEISAAPKSVGGALFGAGTSAIIFWRVAPRFAIALTFGIDLFGGKRVEYDIHGTPALTTDQLALWGGVGIAYEVAR
jgi:hypothetical protein